MIIINRAILHILDFNSNVCVFSEEDLDMGNNDIEVFLSKHVEKSYKDSNLKSGEFLEVSKFQKQILDYKNSQMDFIDFSRFIGDLIYNSLSQTDMMDSLDLIVLDIDIENRTHVGVLLCTNKVGYIHQVTNDNGIIKNEIINHYAILPSMTQKLDGYAFIDLEDLNIKFVDKNRNINGQELYILPEIVLECSSTISQRETIKLVKEVAIMVAENHNESSAIAISKAKNYITENTQESQNLEPMELGKQIFSSSKLMQDEFIREAKEIGIPENIQMDKEFAIKTGKNHKIKTDTGIEVSFPADYFKNTDFIEFINNPDGTISIQLRNIGKIINK